MNPQQELFTTYYTTRGATFYNGTLSYALAYDHDLPKDENGKIIPNTKEYNNCSSHSARLMLNDKVQQSITAKSVALLTDANVDARLSEILNKGQHANSLQAIKIHNDLKQRITKRIDVTTAGRPLANLSDDELLKLAE